MVQVMLEVDIVFRRDAVKTREQVMDPTSIVVIASSAVISAVITCESKQHTARKSKAMLTERNASRLELSSGISLDENWTRSTSQMTT